jgi:hypothetical protein
MELALCHHLAPRISRLLSRFLKNLWARGLCHLIAKPVSNVWVTLSKIEFPNKTGRWSLYLTSGFSLVVNQLLQKVM